MKKEMHKSFEKYLDNVMDFYDIPGISAGVMEGNFRVTGVRGYLGYKDKMPLEMTTIFHCTSISKLFTATGIMKLIEDGKLSLADKVVEILKNPSIADKRWEMVTIENLMSHTAGIPDVDDYRWALHEISEKAIKSYAISEISALKTFSNSPGKAFRYSNIGYSILGAVIEEVTGESFENYMERVFFKPLEMQNSSFLTYKRTEGSFDSETLRGVNFALPHKKAKDRSIVEEATYPYSRRHAPSSTLTSTPEDIIKWAEAIMAGRIIGRRSLEKMWASHVEIKGSREKMGLGWFVDEYSGYEIYGHEGSDDGFRTSFWMCPKKKTAAILMCNITDAPLKKLNRNLMDIFI